MPDEILIAAAEASADQHAARVLEELARLRPGLRAFGLGGPGLRAAGLEALHGAEELSVMGITEVIPRLPHILAVLRDLAASAAERRPRVALLVDSPDFNLRLAARLKRLGVKVIYYVSPMIWAWRPGRARQIARVVDRMLCILPFEERFYQGSGVSARFVGHPLADRPPPESPEHYRMALGLDPARTTIALLPGSRPSELRRLLEPMLGAAERLRARHPDIQFVIPLAPTLPAEAVRASLAAHPSLEVSLVNGQAHRAVGASDVALVKSGTVTLEAALMMRPVVVAYRLSWLSFRVAKLLARVSYCALVNLLAGHRLVPELLQGQASPGPMAAEVERLLRDGPARQAQLAGLAAVRASLGEPGAPRRVAEELVAALST